MRKLILLLLVSILVVSCSETPDIPFVQNGDGFYISFNNLSATDEHRMDLKDGDSLAVNAEIDSGSLHLTVTAPSGEKPVTSNFSEKEFTFNVHEDGTYLFFVKATRLTGRIDVRKIKEK